MPVPVGKRYSPFDPDEVHADMREDPVTTARNVAKQPSVAEKHRSCEVCTELAPPGGPAASRRAQVLLTMSQIAAAMQLPAGCRVVRMWVEPDPQLLHVEYEGPHLDLVPLDEPTPFVQPS